MKTLLLIALLFCAVIGFTQSKPVTDSIPFEIRQQSYIYGMAKKYNDPSVARMALYNLLSYNPTSVPLIDSLSYLYFQYQQYASAAITAQDALSLNPGDLFATEIAAVSFENLGIKVRAVSYYEKLYLANNDLATLYQITFLQYELKRFGEAMNNITTMIENPATDKQLLIFPTADEKGQEISMKAGAYRLKALVEVAQNNSVAAKESLNKALALYPAFEIAKQELAEIK